MNREFQINTRRSIGNLHINITGESNGRCGWQLIKTISRQYAGTGRIFINTACLEKVLSDGADLFKLHMTRRRMPLDCLYLKGEKGFHIAPEGSRVIVFKKPENDRRHCPISLSTLSGR